MQASGDPTQAEVTATIAEALERHAEGCHDEGHAACRGSLLCERVRDYQQAKTSFDSRARSFDVGALAADFEGREPSAAWPTTALLRVVHDGLEQVPWGRQEFRRSVVITSALARLGERGIPADAIVRLCVGPLLARRITVHAVHALAAIRRGQVGEEQLPWQLLGWLPTFEHLPDMDESRLMMSALTGSGVAELNQWIDEGAISHLIVWRRDAERVSLHPDDRVMPGGVDATRWIYDRFTRTRLDEWRTTSLQWELACVERPEDVCQRAGVSVRLIAERPVSADMVVSALGRRVCAATSDAEVLAGMTLSEVMQELVTLSKMKAYDAAITLAARAKVASPASVDLAVAHAFLTIARAPATALAELRTLLRQHPGQRQLIIVNIASALIRQGKPGEEVLELLGRRDVRESGQLAWLWSPDSLVRPDLRLEEYQVCNWVAEIETILTRAREAPLRQSLEALPTRESAP